MDETTTALEAVAPDVDAPGDAPGADPVVVAPDTARSGRRWMPGAALVAVALLAGAVAGGVAGRLSASDAPTAGAGIGSISTASDIGKVLRAVEPAVVSVRTQAFRQGRFFPSQGAGSGIILTADGEVLTNAHVVDGATQIDVTLNGERQARPADVVGTDPAHDVALVKIRNAHGLPVAPLGRSSQLRVGDSVVAIGNALDLGETPTVTEGIVSAVNRSIDAPGESLEGLIQTDAAINPGNSGGALVDARGRVVGINTAIAGDAQNIGFAIPIDKVRPVVDDLRAHRTPSSSSRRGFLGITVGDAAGGGGALVGQVAPGSPAAQAGLRSGDVVTAIDGDEVTGAEQLVAAVRKHEPGDKVKIAWRRGATSQSATVTLATAP